MNWLSESSFITYRPALLSPLLNLRLDRFQSLTCWQITDPCFPAKGFSRIFNGTDTPARLDIDFCSDKAPPPTCLTPRAIVRQSLFMPGTPHSARAFLIRS